MQTHWHEQHSEGEMLAGIYSMFCTVSKENMRYLDRTAYTTASCTAANISDYDKNSTTTNCKQHYQLMTIQFPRASEHLQPPKTLLSASEASAPTLWHFQAWLCIGLCLCCSTTFCRVSLGEESSANCSFPMSDSFVQALPQGSRCGRKGT